MNKGHFLIIANGQDQAYYLKRDLGDLTKYARLESMSIIDYPRIRMHSDLIAYRTPIINAATYEPDYAPAWRRIAIDPRVNMAGLVLMLTKEDNAETVRPQLQRFLEERAFAVNRMFTSLCRQYQAESDPDLCDPFDPPMIFRLLPDGLHKIIILENPCRRYEVLQIDPFDIQHGYIQVLRSMGRNLNVLAKQYPGLIFEAGYAGADRTYMQVSVWLDHQRMEPPALTFAWPISDPVRGKLEQLQEQVTA